MTYHEALAPALREGIVHEGRNGGNAPVKAVAVFVTDKGKPMTTQVH